MKSRHHILDGIKPEQAERMLMDLANVPDLPPAGTMLVKQGQELTIHVRGERIPEGEYRTVRADKTTDQHTAWVEKMKERYPQIFGKCSVADMFALRHLLRAAWDDPDLGRREWFCFLLRKLHAESERLAESLAEDGGAKLILDAQVKKDRLDSFLKPGGRRPVAEMLYNLADSDLVAACKGATPPASNKFESACSHLQRNLNHALHCPNPTCAFPYFFSHEKGRRYCSDACSEWGQRESKRRWWANNRA